MKLSLSIKLLIFFMIFQQITCAVPSGMMLVKNLTGSTSTGVFSLGVHTTGGTVTIKNLISQPFYLNLYHKVFQGGVYTGETQNELLLIGLELMEITLDPSTQEYFLSFNSQYIPKFSIEVKNSDGVVIKAIDQYARGNKDPQSLYIYPTKIFTFKNNCSMYLDSNTLSSSLLSNQYTISLLILNTNTYSFIADLILTSSGGANIAQFNVSANFVGTIRIQPNIPVDLTTFSHGIPIYSPADSQCQIEQIYSCDIQSQVNCHIFNGYKCGGVDYGQCLATACGDGVIDYGEQCEGGGANCVACQLICGNGRIDSGEECDNVTGCGSNCQHLTDYTCFANNTCTKCGNGKVDDPTEQCDGGLNCGTDCKLICGNGRIDSGEDCDGGAGCGPDCKLLCGNGNVDSGQDCDGTADCGTDCKFLCGNGKIDGTQECDNGNKEGCVACKVVSGYVCPLVDGKSNCSLICQTNNILELGEECDNGGKAGCTNCKVVSPYKCNNTLGKPSLCYICGNSIQQQGEECDNGNTTGCVNCTVDRGFTCKTKLQSLSNCTNICGDGIRVDGEECDNGNQTGCINCMIVPRYTCRGLKYTTSKCTSCGNYILEWPEQCDNNNVNGCKNCTIQSGWNCRSNPKNCYRIIAVCGNGERELREDCDDGNKVNGDGCSSLCTKETGYTCTMGLGEKSICNLGTR